MVDPLGIHITNKQTVKDVVKIEELSIFLSQFHFLLTKLCVWTVEKEQRRGSDINPRQGQLCTNQHTRTCAFWSPLTREKKVLRLYCTSVRPKTTFFS